MLPVSVTIEPSSRSGRQVYILRLRRGSKDLMWADFVSGLVNDSQLRQVLSGALADAPLDAFFWETVPVSRQTRQQPFAAVLVHAPMLTRAPPDTRSFADQLTGAACPEVRTFPNLGGDAWLVVPAPAEHPASHVHLAAFLRNAAGEQVHRLWQAVGEAVERWLEESPEPVWVSTSGAGVAWLHIRLDRRPKYITYGPFRAAPSSLDSQTLSPNR